MPSEKYAAHRGSVEDEMRMIPACFARAPRDVRAAHTCIFSSCFMRLERSAKLATSYVLKQVAPAASSSGPAAGARRTSLITHIYARLQCWGYGHKHVHHGR